MTADSTAPLIGPAADFVGGCLPADVVPAGMAPAAIGSAAYKNWLTRGRPCKLSTPVADFSAYLHKHGYPVGTVGDARHMTHVPPEDHTPFSATGWPGHNTYGYVYAIDIMPPSPQSGLPSLARLAALMSADRNAGHVLWIKYMNWTPAGKSCVHESWQPKRAVRASDDVGHIHVSVCSNFTLSHIAATYDPIGRLKR